MSWLNIDALAADAAVPTSVQSNTIHLFDGDTWLDAGTATRNPTPVVTSTNALRRIFASALSVGMMRGVGAIGFACSIELV